MTRRTLALILFRALALFAAATAGIAAAFSLALAVGKAFSPDDHLIWGLPQGLLMTGAAAGLAWLLWAMAPWLADRVAPTGPDRNDEACPAPRCAGKDYLAIGVAVGGLTVFWFGFRRLPGLLMLSIQWIPDHLKSEMGDTAVYWTYVLGSGIFVLMLIGLGLGLVLYARPVSGKLLKLQAAVARKMGHPA